jgi:hypothetical protein
MAWRAFGHASAKSRTCLTSPRCCLETTRLWQYESSCEHDTLPVMLEFLTTKMSAAVAGLVLTLAALAVSATPVHADATKPYGDNVTGHIANVLHGTHRGGWLATTLDIAGYHGKRHAEEIRIAAGHGRRWVGVIHVPVGEGNQAARALSGTWFARYGTRFVLPLVSKDATDGGGGSTFHATAKWAANRLGMRWTVVSP